MSAPVERRARARLASRRRVRRSGLGQLTCTSTRRLRRRRRRRRHPAARRSEQTDLDVIAITDHERIDAALAARDMAEGRGLPLEVIVGEEITTRGGHLVGLFLSRRVRPWHSLRWTSPPSTSRAAWPSAPIPWCPSHVRRRRCHPQRSSRTPTAAVHPDAPRGLQPDDGRAALASARRWPSPRSSACAAVATATRTCRAHRSGARHGLRGPHRDGPAARRSRPATTTWDGALYPLAWRRSACSAGRCARTLATCATRSVASCGATAPAATSATRAAGERPAALRRRPACAAR